MVPLLLEEARVDLADITVLVKSSTAGKTFQIPEVHRSFLTTGLPQVTVRAHFGSLPDIDLGRITFETSGVWCLHESNGKRIVNLRGPGPDGATYKLGVFSPDFHSGDVYTVRDAAALPGSLSYPLAYPLEEVLMINLLPQYQGILFHAAAVSHNGRGYLFVGASGAGKSTMSVQWERERDSIVLSDDRVIVRRREGCYWAYGTPWHGTAETAAPLSVPLEQIFLIKHAGKNEATALPSSAATARLLAYAFPTYWNAAGMSATLDLLVQLSQTVSCYELGFVPDHTVVDYIQCLSAN
jgi:hypothetical protein